MRSQEAVQFFTAHAAGTSATVTLEGGKYVSDVVATGTGTVTTERLGPDASTFLTAFTAQTATGPSAAVDLPPGQYRSVTSGLTVISHSLTRVPND